MAYKMLPFIMLFIAVLLVACNGSTENNISTDTAQENDAMNFIHASMQDMQKMSSETIALGLHHGAVITDDGVLWAWGWSPYGRVDPIRIMDDVVTIAANRERTAIIRSDGSLWLWDLVGGSAWVWYQGISLETISARAP